MTQLPFIGDPKRRGPVDLAASAYSKTLQVLEDNLTVIVPSVIISLTVLAALVWHFGISWPGMPNWFWVSVIVVVLAAPYGWLLGKGMAVGLYESAAEVISVQNPANGDQRIQTVDPDRFEAMTVLNQNGKKRDLGFLHRVRINGVLCYELDSYDKDKNIGVASWQAGQSNSSIRSDKAQIKRIKTDLEKEADKALELIANYPEILRKHATEVANRLVKASLGIELPEGSKLHESLTETISEADPSEGLLDDVNDIDDDTDDDTENETMKDIFERAAEIENGKGAVADDD